MEGTITARHRFREFDRTGDDAWINYRILIDRVITGERIYLLELADLGDALDNLERILGDAERMEINGRFVQGGSITISIQQADRENKRWVPLPTTGNGMPDFHTWTFPQ